MQNGRQRGRVVRAPDLNILRSRVQIPFWPPADHDVVLGSPEFNFSSTVVNSQLVCLPPVEIFNLVMFIYHYLFILVLKSPNGEWPITTESIYIYTCILRMLLCPVTSLCTTDFRALNFIEQTKSTQKISRRTKTQRREKKQTFTSLGFWK